MKNLTDFRERRKLLWIRAWLCYLKIPPLFFMFHFLSWLVPDD